MNVQLNFDFQQYFSNIMATGFSGGGSRSTRREPPTMGKQLVSFITCGCESSATKESSVPEPTMQAYLCHIFLKHGLV
jgi:hypothetical protein